MSSDLIEQTNIIIVDPNNPEAIGMIEKIAMIDSSSGEEKDVFIKEQILEVPPEIE